MIREERFTVRLADEELESLRRVAVHLRRRSRSDTIRRLIHEVV